MFPYPAIAATTKIYSCFRLLSYPWLLSLRLLSGYVPWLPCLSVLVLLVQLLAFGLFLHFFGLDFILPWLLPIAVLVLFVLLHLPSIKDLLNIYLSTSSFSPSTTDRLFSYLVIQFPFPLELQRLRHEVGWELVIFQVLSSFATIGCASPHPYC